MRSNGLVGSPAWIRAIPIVLLLGVSALPVVWVAAHAWLGRAILLPEAAAPSLVFAFGGAAISLVTGTFAGLVVASRQWRGLRLVTILLAAPLAAPPAFWWIGFTRWSSLVPRGIHGPIAAAIVAGIALAPIPFLFTFAALREIPASSDAAARLFLSPARRLFRVLLPMSRSALASAFLLVTILLLGESEIPFLFGFRTVMTDIVTAFARTFDARAIAPHAAPLLVAVLALAALLSRALSASLLSPARGNRGIARSPATATDIALAAALVTPFGVATLGHLRPVVDPSFASAARQVASLDTFAISVAEPLVCAWCSLILGVAALYPLRSSPLTSLVVALGLVVFAVPAGLVAIGWIGIGAWFGGMVLSPIHVFVLRFAPLAAAGFAAAYARSSPSYEAAARLVAVSPLRRAARLVLPPLAPSLSVIALLVAALAFADRDVSSLLAAPGRGRLMLDLYLASANAPAATLAALALLVFVGAILLTLLAAAGPWLALRYRG